LRQEVACEPLTTFDQEENMTDANKITSLEQASGERSLSLIFSTFAPAAVPAIASANDAVQYQTAIFCVAGLIYGHRGDVSSLRCVR
jgi:hypothetical protein